MVKHFLIDGYNLAYKLYTVKNNLQQVRDKVQRLVSNYAMRKKCQATIVFDGKWNLDTVEHYSNVTVVFTTSGEIADTRIKKIIDETPNKSSLCVVSSDREILRYAQVSRTQTMRSEEFLFDLKTDATSNSKKLTKSRSNKGIKKEVEVREHKPNEVSTSDIETWKKLFE